MLLRVPIENVISGVIRHVEWAIEVSKGKKSPVKSAHPEFKYEAAQKEAAVCLFIYGYLVYTYDWYKKEEKQEQKLNSLRAMWNNLVNLFKYHSSVTKLGF